LPWDKKTVYFVRHAESMSNVYKKRMATRPWALCQLCSIGFNAPLSRKGREQLPGVRGQCQEILPQLEAVLHSPLLRAEETAKALFGAVDPDHPGEFKGGLPESPVPWVSLQALMEEQLPEHLEEKGFGFCGGPGSSTKASSSSRQMCQRVGTVLAFLWECPWDNIGLVGHSIWIRILMQLGGPGADAIHVANANLWRLTLGPPAEPGALPQVLAYELIARPQPPPTKLTEPLPAVVPPVPSGSTE
jgi:broad specificity phosphatase PhoE